MLYGNNEAVVMNQHFVADCEYIQQRFRIRGGEVPDNVFAEYLREYITDLKEADRQGFIPQWATRLFREDYEIILYR